MLFEQTVATTISRIESSVFARFHHDNKLTDSPLVDLILSNGVPEFNGGFELKLRAVRDTGFRIGQPVTVTVQADTPTP